MTRIAYIDESQRNGFYAMAAVTIAPSDVPDVRRQVRTLAPIGVRRRHFVKESDTTRRQMLDVFKTSPALNFVWITTAAAAVVDQRRLVLQALLETLAGIEVDRIVFDHVDHHQQLLDRRVLAHTLRGTDISYSFEVPHASEPMLWIPDAVAWCAGRPHWKVDLEPWVQTIRL